VNRQDWAAGHDVSPPSRDGRIFCGPEWLVGRVPRLSRFQDLGPLTHLRCDDGASTSPEFFPGPRKGSLVTAFGLCTSYDKPDGSQT
jgi:hypothetical protein